MKTQKTIALLAFLLCGTVLFAQKTEDRKVKSFESISLAISAKVYVSQGNKTSVTIKGNAEYLDKIITEVEGSTLKIKRKKMRGRGWYRNSLNKVEIYISTPNVENLAISGSGNITAQTPIKSGSVNYAISGSGNIRINDLSAEMVECHISGSGNINLKGDGAKNLTVHISGSGDIDAGYLKCENVGVRISGSGDCKVYATGNLNAKVAGSGDIYYRGKPESVVSKSAGSGRIRSIGM